MNTNKLIRIILTLAQIANVIGLLCGFFVLATEYNDAFKTVLEMVGCVITYIVLRVIKRSMKNSHRLEKMQARKHIDFSD